MSGDDTKIFAATNFVCHEVFKQTREKLYTESEQGVTPNA
jgi:hypothetical protein